MALKTFVKISGVNNLSDARYCAGMGVNQLGFNIEDKHLIILIHNRLKNYQIGFLVLILLESLIL